MDWRHWIKREWTSLVIFGLLFLSILLGQLRPSVLTDGPGVVSYSPLLDWDLPGAVTNPDRAAATARIQAAAKRQHLECGTVEVHRTEEPAVVHAALEDAQAEQHYLRYQDKKDRTLSRWEGPNRLLVVEREDELLLCELDWPVRG